MCSLPLLTPALSSPAGGHATCDNENSPWDTRLCRRSHDSHMAVT